MTVRSTDMATRLPLSLRETPQAMSVLTQKFLDDFTLQTANDALSNATGLTVQRVETNRTYVSARGFDVSTYQYDGIGLPFSQGTQVGDIDTAVYDNIQVLRGANGLLSSTGNPSATINYTRKRATKVFKASIQGTTGSWNKRRAVGDISGSPMKSGRLRGRLIAVYENADSYLDRYSQEKTTVFGTIEADITKSTLLRLGYSWEQNDPNSSMWGALPLNNSDGTPTHYSRSTSTAARYAYMNNRDSQMFGDLTQKIGNNWKLRLYGTEHILEADGHMFYAYGQPDRLTGLGLKSYPSRYNSREKQWIGDLSLQGKFRVLSQTQQIVLGGNTSSGLNRQLSLYGAGIGTALPPLEGWDGNYPQPAYTAGQNTAHFNYIRRSFYSVLRLSITHKLHLFGGVNLTHATSSGQSYGVQSNYNITKPVPYTGATYDFLKNYTFYISYGKIFNPQTQLDNHHHILGAVQGDNLEGGIKASWFDNKLNLSITGYHVHQNNLANPGGYLANGEAYYNTINAQSAGTEFDISGQIIPGLQIMAGGNLMKLYDENDHAVRTFVPRQTFHSALTWDIPWIKRLHVGINLTWQGRMRNTYTLDSGIKTTAKQNNYALLDFMFHYDITKKWKITGNFNNVTNKKYWSSLYWSQSYYGSPFSGYVTLTHQF
ncbi:TonB-dependent siderophore receptor [Saccharibacter sp. 17.LH.SD]|uniref:TonB-dependent siderophore receptor n=1 Tax=Saccharibacter sp. 17.LH.SD TaxID=2689393 RepID=UPI00137206A2|nr:TonB-dependent siderophore receptor [Saccharibacter sp. 17.LH.SD]MXV43714.1 TonB-dependent siderophore receptor [Saccharibacter sp. 17.LH.SD]